MLKIAWTEKYVLPLPANHRFPMSKYEVLPQQLLHEGTIRSDNLFAPSPVEERWILATHDPVYWQKLSTLTLSPKEVRRTGFPLNQHLVDREVVIAYVKLMATNYAKQFGIAMNIAGCTHHAFSYRG